MSKRFVSLFAGVGGFDLGLEQQGHICVGQVEIDKHARAILEKHWPNVPKHDDVQTATEWAEQNGLIGTVDLVVGGFPCQDLSVAGKRAGLAGKRSGLFFDALAFAQTVKAKTIILENVPGLLSSNQGRDFGQLLTELANAGYSNIEWRVLNSQFFGVAQRRRRVFIVASVGTEPFKQILAECEGSAGDSSQGKPQGQDSADSVADSTGAGSGVSPTLTAYNLDSRSPQSEEQQRMVNAVLEAQSGAGRRGGIGSDLVGSLCASDYKFPQQQQVMENKVVVQEAFGQSSFAGFTQGVTTLTATDYKRPEQNIVVRQES
jgi:DNA (cytosine-5)-methyltransferase 1